MIRFVYALPKARLFVLLAASSFVCGCSEQTSDTAPSPTPPVSPSPAATAVAAAAASPTTDQYFANLKPVNVVPANRSEPKGDLTFTIDVLEAKDKVLRIRGWGFRLNPARQKGDTVTVLLVGSGGVYSASTNVDARPDVSTVLKQPGLDDTGFVGLIDTSTVQPGDYTVFLRIGGADGEAIKSTNRTLTL